LNIFQFSDFRARVREKEDAVKIIIQMLSDVLPRKRFIGENETKTIWIVDLLLDLPAQSSTLRITIILARKNKSRKLNF
jgi:hypothetical protein